MPYSPVSAAAQVKVSQGLAVSTARSFNHRSSPRTRSRLVRRRPGRALPKSTEYSVSDRGLIVPKSSPSAPTGMTLLTSMIECVPEVPMNSQYSSCSVRSSTDLTS